MQPTAATPAELPAEALVTKPVQPAYAAVARAAVVPALASPAAPTAPKVNLVQRLVLKKLARQVTKAQSHSQNVAGVAHTASRGGSFTIAIIGLIAWVVGLIVNSGLLITIGLIVLVVGLILALLSIF